MDKKAFRTLSYGLYCITSKAGERASGCIANTFTQVTSTPARVSIALNKDNYTTTVIEESKVFNCAVLLEEVSMDSIRNFGFQSGRDMNKFENIKTVIDSHGIPQMSEGVAATFTCKVIEQVDVGTHILFIADVVDCQSVSDETVLTYANYHSKKKGTTPKNAPSFVEETTKTGYRCTICGFILEEEELPVDYICPVCGAPAGVFEKV